MLFNNKKRLVKFLGCILIGLPIWYVIGVLITFSPEFAKQLGVNEKIVAGDSVMYSYIGLTVGGLLSGLISQAIRSRKKVVLAFILTTLAVVVHYIYLPFHSTAYFYGACFLLGVGTGYWAIFVTIAAEQFGTNLRSTAATTTPNFIRGTVVPITLSFKYLRGSMGILNGALVVGIVTVGIALIALRAIDETYGRDLNFLEKK